MPTDENAGIVTRFFVLDSVAIRDWSLQLTRLENSIEIGLLSAEHDDCLWRWIPIAAQPVRIDSADRVRQTVGRTVEVDRPSFAVISG